MTAKKNTKRTILQIKGIAQLKKVEMFSQTIQYALREGEKSITEFCTHMKLSIPTGTKVVQELMELGILLDVGKRESKSGRRPSLFSLNPSVGYVVGVEVLLSSLRICLMDLSHQFIHEYRCDYDISDQDAAYKTLVKQVMQVLKTQKIPSSKVIGACLAITGRVSRKTGTSYTYLYFDKPLAELLKSEWNFPVFVENDSRLMALGEQRFGKAMGKQDAIFINLSRGLGIGIISNGNIHNGHSGFAGEFGHIRVADSDKVCVCGKMGCLETIVSGLALEDFHEAAYGQRLSYEAILPKLLTGDKAIKSFLAGMGEKLGKSLAILVDVFNPELMVIGGGFMSVAEYMKFAIIKGINLEGLPRLTTDCNLEVSVLGQKAIMLGAFSVVTETAFNPSDFLRSKFH